MHGEELQKIAETLNPYPLSPQQVLNAAREIRKIFEQSANHDNQDDQSFDFQTDLVPDEQGEEPFDEFGRVAYPNQGSRKGKVVWQNIENSRAAYAIDLESEGVAMQPRLPWRVSRRRVTAQWSIEN